VLTCISADASVMVVSRSALVFSSAGKPGGSSSSKKRQVSTAYVKEVSAGVEFSRET
jgi:hypothetical protein